MLRLLTICPCLLLWICLDLLIGQEGARCRTRQTGCARSSLGLPAAVLVARLAAALSVAAAYASSGRRPSRAHRSLPQLAQRYGAGGLRLSRLRQTDKLGQSASAGVPIRCLSLVEGASRRARPPATGGSAVRRRAPGRGSFRALCPQREKRSAAPLRAPQWTWCRPRRRRAPKRPS